MARSTFALVLVALMGLACAARVNTAGHVESVRQIDSTGPGESDGTIESVGPVQTDSRIEAVGRQCTRRCYTICPPNDKSGEGCKQQCFTVC